MVVYRLDEQHRSERLASTCIKVPSYAYNCLKFNIDGGLYGFGLQIICSWCWVWVRVKRIHGSKDIGWSKVMG